MAVVQVLRRAVCAFDGLFDSFGFGRELGHGRPERSEVVDHGLVNQHVAVGQEQDTLSCGRPSTAAR